MAHPATLQAPAPIIVPIDTFAPDQIDLVRPLHIVIQPVDDEFVATFFDANVNASGSTQQEALMNVKDMIVAQFLHLEKKKEEELGKARKRQRAALLSVMKRRD